MQPELWARVRAVFEQALDLADNEREAFVVAACAGDESLCREVLAMLRADAHDGGAPPLVELASAGALAMGGLVGAEIGGFHVVRLLGVGGMGAVYEAQQQRPQRRVALKALASRLPSERARRRFEDEAEILARLRHPAIAQVFEAGRTRTPAGEVCWFAMELIDEPSTLDRYAHEHRIAARAIAALLIAVCEAVHYAHQRGVIHRDLKPANVLVDRAGQVKVIDFGIARLADPQALARRTRTGEIVGTLAYMSPERLEHADRDDDTAGDVYALGVILYELLAGVAPFEIAALPPTRALEVLRAADPPPPSRHNPAVPVDLDWVTLRAMAREPSRRYASAAELAQDLSRWLRHEAVAASPPSAVYRLRKLARRHRVLLGVAAGAFVVVSIGFLVAATGWSRVAAAEQKARRDASVLEQVNQFQQHILRGAYGTERGRDVRLSDALAAASRDLEQRRFEDPWVEVGVRSAMATSYMGLGQLDVAERHLLRARDIMVANTLDGREPAGISLRHNLATCWMNLGKLEAAEQEFRTVLADRLAQLGQDAELTARAQNNLAAALLKRAQPAEALSLAEAALATFTRRVGIGSEEAINARSTIALALTNLQRLDEADRVFAETAALAAEHLAEDHPARLAAASVRGTQLHRRGRYREALVLDEEVAQARERLLGPEHPDTLTAWSNVGADRLALGEHAAAEAAFRHVLAGQRAVGLQGYPLLVTQQNLAVALRRQGRAADAEPLTRAQREAAGQCLPADHWLLGVITKEHGGCLRDLERFAEAEPLLLAAHEHLARVVGKSDYRTQKVLGELVALYEAWSGHADELARWRAQLADDETAK